MNQDFTVQKKAIFVWKKKFVQRGSPEKKIPAQAVGEKKKFVQAENSPPHHFSIGPSLRHYLKLIYLKSYNDHNFGKIYQNLPKFCNLGKIGNLNFAVT